MLITKFIQIMHPTPNKHPPQISPHFDEQEG